MTIKLEIKNTGTETLTIEPGQTKEVEVIVADPPEEPEGTLSAAATAWATAHASDQKLVGGPDAFVSDSYVSGGSAGRTFVEVTPRNIIRQHGPITAFKYTAYVITAGGWKFKILRPNGSGGYTQVGESQSFNPPSVGTHTLTLTTPISGCQPGDVIGCYLPSSSAVIRCSADANADCAYVVGDQTSFSSPTVVADARLDIQALGPAPFLAVIGDSLGAGHGEAYHRPFLDGSPMGNPLGEPAHYIREAFPSLTYQNWSKGGQNWDHAASVISPVATLGPRAVLFILGANETRAWSVIQGIMNSCKAALATGTAIFVKGVPPQTANSDTAANYRRDLNDNYAAWCTSNGAVFIPCDDVMGQVRTSTGHLDDLKTALNHDGTHHTIVGVEAFSEPDTAALDSFEWAA